jgi:hypothetical protein
MDWRLLVEIILLWTLVLIVLLAVFGGVTLLAYALLALMVGACA